MNIGTTANDTLQGTALNDLVFGEGGDDLILGYAGDDQLFGNWGNDQVNGGAGDDTSYGGTGDDWVLGELGSDFLVGNLGNDTLEGGEDNDVLLGESGSDLLDGGNGNDTLLGASISINEPMQIDTLTGGAGWDVFVISEVGQSYYGNFAENDFALITDLEPGVDVIRGDYLTQNSYSMSDITLPELGTGTGIFINTNTDRGQDLIAFIPGSMSTEVLSNLVFSPFPSF